MTPAKKEMGWTAIAIAPELLLHVFADFHDRLIGSRIVVAPRFDEQFFESEERAVPYRLREQRPWYGHERDWFQSEERGRRGRDRNVG